MVPKSLPEANPKIRTHPFTAEDGRRCRVVDAGEHSDPHLEVNGRADGPCHITGPEILKLSEQGRALWNMLSKVHADFQARVYAYRGWKDERGRIALIEEMAAVLGQTAATFDHNEPEVPDGQ